MQIIKVKNNTKYPFNENQEDSKNFKLISYGDGFISFVTNNNKVYFLYPEITLEKENVYEFEEAISNFGNIIYLKSFRNVTIIVNENHDIFQIDINVHAYITFSIKKIYLNTFNFLPPIEKIKFVRGNTTNMFFVMDNNEIYVFDRKNNDKQTKKEFPLKIKDLQCGNVHSILLLQNGEIYGMGDNKNGQLGIIENVVNNFTFIPLPFKVKKISCYSEGTLLLNNFNELYGTGNNSEGELGLRHRDTVNTFTKIVITNMNDKIINIFGCPTVDCNIILTEKLDFFMAGSTLTNKGEGLVEEFHVKSYMIADKLYYLDTFTTIYYLDTFTKIKDFEITKKYLYPIIWENDLLVVMTDFKLNDFELEEDRYTHFQRNLHLQLGHRICDVSISTIC